MTFEGWELILTGVGIVGSTVGVNKILLASAVKSIKHHCGMQKEQCAQWHRMSEEDRRKLWSHGHKGLDGNGSKVTV